MPTPELLHPRNPATEAPLPPVPVTSAQEVARAFERARAAAGAWRAAGVDGRVEALRRAHERLSAASVAEALARSIQEEMGKPIRSARAEVQVAAGRFAPFFEHARAACAPRRAQEAGVDVITTWRALGVCAVIAPWNYPVATPNNLVLSALLTGNTCILKPSELTPHTGARYVDALAASLPDGVLQVVQGGGAVGGALVAGADHVAFTGSVETGQAIMRASAEHMTRLVLEMGGNDPMLVLPGADLDVASRHAATVGLANCGQMCVAVERVLVHRDLHDEFLERLVARVGEVKVGDPADEATQMGPMSSEAQRAQVEAHIAAARAAGARVVVEAKRRAPGFFLTPCVLDGVSPAMQVAREETFGPLLSVETVQDSDEAVARANDSIYGLGASVWGAPGAELDAIAARLEAGMVGINRGLSAAGGAPWVGWKMSGFGFSRSVEGMRQFMLPQTFSRPA